MAATTNGNGTRVSKAPSVPGGITAEIGSAGLKRAGGLVQEEFLTQLRGVKGQKVYAEMAANDSTVGAVLLAFEMLLRDVSWFTKEPENPSGKTAMKKAVEFVDSLPDDMSHSWQALISEALSFLTFGWSFHEIVYKYRRGDNEDPASRYDDGMIGWRKLPIRAQETRLRWEFDRTGGVAAMVQLAPDASPPGPRTIPIEKGLLFRTTSRKSSPEGKSPLRSAYRSWYLRKRIEEIEGIGIERDLAGLPAIGVPPDLLEPDAPSELKAALEVFKEIGTNLRNDEQSFVLYPLAYDEHGNKRYDVGLLSSGGKRNFDTSLIIERYSRQIAMAALADVILLGHEKVGSFALADAKRDLLTAALEAWVDEIADVLNRFALPRVCRLNGIAPEDVPSFAHERLEAVDLTKLSAAFQQFSAAGMSLFPDKDLEEWVRNQAGMPPVSDEVQAERDKAEAAMAEAGPLVNTNTPSPITGQRPPVTVHGPGGGVVPPGQAQQTPGQPSPANATPARPAAPT